METGAEKGDNDDNVQGAIWVSKQEEKGQTLKLETVRNLQLCTQSLEGDVLQQRGARSGG